MARGGPRGHVAPNRDTLFPRGLSKTEQTQNGSGATPYAQAILYLDMRDARQRSLSGPPRYHDAPGRGTGCKREDHFLARVSAKTGEAFSGSDTAAITQPAKVTLVVSPRSPGARTALDHDLPGSEQGRG